MAIHFGELIQQEIDRRRLTHREFGAMIHRSEKTVPDILARASISTDLLLNICAALQKDFFKYLYEEEPLKSLEAADSSGLKVQVQQLSMENKMLQRELDLTQQVVIMYKENNELLKERNKLVQYLPKEANLLDNQTRTPSD